MLEANKDKTEVKAVLKVDSELLDNISELINDHAAKSILNIFNDLHHADIAEIINHLKHDDATYVFNLLDTETAGEVITDLDENLREKILKFIDPAKITEIVDELDSDDATDIVSDLPEEIAEHVLENIDEESSEEVKELLKYEEDSAGGIMSSDFVCVDENAFIKDAIKEVRNYADEFDQIYHIYILTADKKLTGVVSLKSLLLYPFQTKLNSIMEEDLIYVTPEMDQEEVANIMDKYDLVAIPVVDNNNVMIGRITIDDIVDVIQEEASEDMQKIAGISDDEETSDSVFRISKNRLPWLIVALSLQLLNTRFLEGFQEEIKVLFEAAITFVPLVMAMGGSSGSQSAIVMVRSISLGEVWFSEAGKRLLKELRIALINSVILGSILFLIRFFLFNNPFPISLLLTSSLVAVIVFATMLGATLPLVFKKIGIDPATATGPFVNTVNDILGAIIYILLIKVLYPIL